MMKAKIHFPNYERRHGTNSSVIHLDGIEGYAHLTLCSYSQHHVHWSRLASYLMKSQSRPPENLNDHFTRCKIVLFTPSLLYLEFTQPLNQFPALALTPNHQYPFLISASPSQHNFQFSIRIYPHPSSQHSIQLYKLAPTAIQ